jgi:hypothetical protein
MKKYLLALYKQYLQPLQEFAKMSDELVADLVDAIKH